MPASLSILVGSTGLVLAVSLMGLRTLCASVGMHLVLHELAVELGKSLIEKYVGDGLAFGVDDLLDAVVLVVTA